MTKILITGITGYVGGSLARALVEEEDVELFGLIRPSSNLEPLSGLDVTCMEADITVRPSLKGVFDWVDYVIHAAGMLGEAGIPESTYHRVHVDGTNNVLSEIESLDDPPKVLYVSSPGVLGPITGEPAAETAVHNPSNPYERSKSAAEMMVKIYADHGLPVTIVRPEFIYGPRDMHVLGLFQAIQNGRFFTINQGKNVCHPTYIEDAVRGMLQVLRHGRNGQIYHITGPEPVTFRELTATIAEACGVSAPKRNLPRSIALAGATGLEIAGSLFKFKPPLSRSGVAFFSEDRRFSWQKAHDELDYTPQFSLKTGIEKTVAWYKEQGYLN